MPHIAVTTTNPFGLSLKQRLFVADIVTTVKQGKPVSAVESIKKMYEVSSHNSAKTLASQNLSKRNIKEALDYELEKVGITGKHSKVEQRLEEGLDAMDGKGHIDYGVRLKYIQEINKIVGVYDKPITTTVTQNLHINMSSAELDKKIQQLQEELQM